MGSNDNIYENTIDTERQENMLSFLEDEIEKLEKQITKTEEKQDNVLLGGVTSIKHGMISLAHIPIGSFIAIKVLSRFLLSGVDPNILLNSIIPLSGSTVLGIYFTVPITGILLVFSLMSNKYFKDCLAEKESYAAIIEYLKEELNAKVNKREQLKKSLSFSENTVIYEDHERTKRARERMINILKLYRKRIIYTYILDMYLEEVGVSKEEVRPPKKETARVFRIEKED